MSRTGLFASLARQRVNAPHEARQEENKERGPKKKKISAPIKLLPSSRFHVK